MNEQGIAYLISMINADPRFRSPCAAPRVTDKLSGIDIEAEYNLIQQKKSKLSSSMRKAVVARYERTMK